MDINGVTNHRFLRPSPTPGTSILSDNTNNNNNELNESEILWTTTTTDSTQSTPRRKLGFRRQNSGILAALPDADGNIIAPPAATPVRSIPKPNRAASTESAQSKSAPINVPMMTTKPRRLGQLDVVVDDDDDEEEEEMLPPHEMVERKVKTSSSSVLEGVGRTLKGRDLRQVRNAVWRQTGFLD